MDEGRYDLKLGRRVAGCNAFEFYTVRHPLFTELRNKWYPCGIKVVPRDIVLNPEILAWWFCDDGYNKRGRKEAAFSTCSFSDDDCRYLIEQLKAFGLDCYLYQYGENFNLIKVRSSSHQKLIDIISPFIQWKCMSYKLGRD
jgi:hypothetical protein